MARSTWGSALADGEPSINPLMSAEELRESWQGRALLYSRKMEQFAPALLSLLADNYDETMPFLLRAVFPEAAGIRTPFYCSNPKIDKRGRIVADCIERDGERVKNKVIFVTAMQMEAIFRVLADRLKLNDDDRRELFVCIHHWVKADMRLDPTMDRLDPDAKRLTAH